MLFKNAYVRGLQTALVNSGHATYPDEVSAHKVADYIADRVELDLSSDVPREMNEKIATQLLEASLFFKKQPSFKAASWNKLATWDDVRALADRSAEQLMVKAAEGSTIEGGDKGNDEPSSGEAKMDAHERPVGYAEDSRGKTDVDTKPGAVGKEEDQPKKPSETDSKPNSVTEQSRTASLRALFNKAAEGSTIIGGDKGNAEPTTAEGKMDAALRPTGYAVLPNQGDLGEMMKLVTGPAVVGKEMAQPMQPGQTVSGSNSLTEHSAKAASEDPFITLFKKTASEIVEYLPGQLSESAKVAAVRACIGLTTPERAHYLVELQKTAAIERTAGVPAEVPPGSRTDKYTGHSPEATHSRPGAYDGRSNNQGTKSAEDGALPPFMTKKKDDSDDDKKDDKKDDKGGMPSFIQDKIDAKKSDGDSDKKDDDKKEASLIDHMRRIQAAQRA